MSDACRHLSVLSEAAAMSLYVGKSLATNSSSDVSNSLYIYMSARRKIFKRGELRGKTHHYRVIK